MVDELVQLAFSAGIVDSRIETPEADQSLIEKTTGITVVPDDGLDEEGFPAELLEFGLECLFLYWPTTRDDELGTAALDAKATRKVGIKVCEVRNSIFTHGYRSRACGFTRHKNFRGDVSHLTTRDDKCHAG